MTRALACASEGTPANKAAILYGVPKSTLRDRLIRLSGCVVRGCNPGPRPYLDPTDEKMNSLTFWFPLLSVVIENKV